MLAEKAERAAAERLPVLIETRRGPVECTVWGEGPAILLLHGAMGGYDQGILLARAAVASSEFRFIAVSRPGYLGTPLTLGKTPEEQGDLCAGLLDFLKIRKAVIIAISGGGQTAIQFALRHRDRCLALVMISACSAQLKGALPLKFQLLKWLARFPALVALAQKRTALDADAAARRSIPDPELRARTLNDPEAGPLLRALLSSTMDQLPRRLPGTSNDIAQSRLPFRYPLEQISVPLLVIHGSADQSVPFADAQQLAARVPGAELLPIQGGEHVSLFTHLHDIRPRISGFLKSRMSP